jgi:type IV secretory pathway ATPase VirB11/archaellum biosynthesis ATPase
LVNHTGLGDLPVGRMEADGSCSTGEVRGAPKMVRMGMGDDDRSEIRWFSPDRTDVLVERLCLFGEASIDEHKPVVSCIEQERVDALVGELVETRNDFPGCHVSPSSG